MGQFRAPSIGDVPRRFGSPPQRTESARWWVCRTTGSTADLQTYVHRVRGAASLVDMSLRVVATQLPFVDHETLRNVPWPVAARLWRLMLKHNLTSIHTWKAFVRVYGEDIGAERIPSLMLCTNNPRITTQALVSPDNSDRPNPMLRQLTAPSLEWITLLSIFNTTMSRHSWIKLTELKNLGALYVENSDATASGLDDIVVRRWSAAGDAFPALKVIMLRNQIRLTLGVLEHFSALSALRIMHITGPTLRAEGIEDIVRSSRWKWMSKSSLCLRLYQTWYSVATYTTLLKDMYIALLKEEDAGSTTAHKPVLNMLSGVEPNTRQSSAPKQDQMWFELMPPEPLTSARSSTLLSNKRRISSQEGQSRKVREDRSRTTSDLLGSLW